MNGDEGERRTIGERTGWFQQAFGVPQGREEQSRVCLLSLVYLLNGRPDPNQLLVNANAKGLH